MTNVLTRNKSNKDFSRVPMTKKPPSVFGMGHSRLMTMDTGYLYPICMEEVLPNDTWEMDLETFNRMATQIVPAMDNLYLKTYFFFVPYRLVWENFPKQHGERLNPDDTIDYITPVINSGETGFDFKSIYDYMGQIPPEVPNIEVSALPFRAYNKIWNEYFRDENLQDSLEVKTDDSDDEISLYNLVKKAKVHDYFTSALPSIQKGDPITLPIGTTAPVVGNGKTIGLSDGTTNYGLTNSYGSSHPLQLTTNAYGTDVGSDSTGNYYDGNTNINIGLTTDGTKSGLEVNLTEALGATITTLRTAIATQQLLEHDNRYGTRYTEMLESRYGATNPDLRLNRAQYLGGTSKMISMIPVVQTSSTGQTGATTPQGNLTAYGVVSDSGRVITQSFNEFGCIIGLACIQGIPQYQNGLGRKWTRKLRYDYYYPEFANLSDQAILNQEIFAQDGTIMNTDETMPVNEEAWGYQERYAEYRYQQNEIVGEMRSSYPTTLDIYHFAENFEELPPLNENFIQENAQTERIIAVQDEAQFISYFGFNSRVYRYMPVNAKPSILPYL